MHVSPDGRPLYLCRSLEENIFFYLYFVHIFYFCLHSFLLSRILKSFTSSYSSTSLAMSFHHPRPGSRRNPWIPQSSDHSSSCPSNVTSPPNIHPVLGPVSQSKLVFTVPLSTLLFLLDPLFCHSEVLQRPVFHFCPLISYPFNVFLILVNKDFSVPSRRRPYCCLPDVIHHRI